MNDRQGSLLYLSAKCKYDLYVDISKKYLTCILLFDKNKAFVTDKSFRINHDIYHINWFSLLRTGWKAFLCFTFITILVYLVNYFEFLLVHLLWTLFTLFYHRLQCHAWYWCWVAHCWLVLSCILPGNYRTLPLTVVHISGR